MRKLVSMVLVLWAASAHADPGWLSPNMQKEDCEGLHWRELPMCESDYYEQQLNKVRSHYRRMISSLDRGTEESCDLGALLETFDSMEASWDAYGAARCELQCHCVGACGSGHSMCSWGCHANVRRTRYEQLTEQMEYNYPIWGCPMSLKERIKILRTPRFDITLGAGCELGFFDCEDVRYRGVNRETQESLELQGRRLRDCTWDEPCVWKGYEFENEGIVYRIDETGTLEVLRSEDGTILVSERGTWETVR
ncbi:MAG: hypothetical protein MPN21_08980 [Thermoanaerobaculia bacterium]|nr:hypothetical protein [Thermoanaerobaculia bacterium]